MRKAEVSKPPPSSTRTIRKAQTINGLRWADAASQPVLETIRDS
jgi:hypothetical protein